MDAHAVSSTLSGGLQKIEDVISKLKFIGKLQEGDKINTTQLYVQKPTYATSLARTLSYENRSETYNFIKDVINQAFDIVFSFSQSTKKFERNICFNIIDDLLQAKNGLENLKLTYTEDVMYVSQIDTMNSLIDAKIEELKQQSGVTDFLKKKEAARKEAAAKKEKAEALLLTTSETKTVASQTTKETEKKESPPEGRKASRVGDLQSPPKKVKSPPKNSYPKK